jgi:hypothetical protein
VLEIVLEAISAIQLGVDAFQLSIDFPTLLNFTVLDSEWGCIKPEQLANITGVYIGVAFLFIGGGIIVTAAETVGSVLLERGIIDNVDDPIAVKVRHFSFAPVGLALPVEVQGPCESDSEPPTPTPQPPVSTPVAPPPAAPSNVRVITVECFAEPCEGTLQWEDESGNETGFYVYSNSPECGLQQVGEAPADSTEWTLPEATACMGPYGVSAFNAAGESSISWETSSTFSDPFDYCAAAGTVDQPDSRYTGSSNPTAVVRGLEVARGLPLGSLSGQTAPVGIPWRCFSGDVWACDPGANLPCWAADTSPEPTQGMKDYCQQNPDSFLPFAVTGHATIFEWTCQGGMPVITRQVYTVDPRGFVAQYWYRIPPPSGAEQSAGPAQPAFRMIGPDGTEYEEGQEITIGPQSVEPSCSYYLCTTTLRFAVSPSLPASDVHVQVTPNPVSSTGGGYDVTYANGNGEIRPRTAWGGPAGTRESDAKGCFSKFTIDINDSHFYVRFYGACGY